MKNKFEIIQDLIDAHMKFDVFMQADFDGKWIPAKHVQLVMKSVEDGTYSQADVSKEAK